MMANTRAFVIGLMVLSGMLAPIGTLRAECRISGKLYYNDGATPVGAADKVAVEVYDVDGNPITQNASGGPIVTMHGTTRYEIAISPSDIQPNMGDDKSITIIYKLNGNVDRQVAGVNTRSTRPFGMDIDIGFTKAPAKRSLHLVTATITGTWTYEDGVTPISRASHPNIHVYFADGTELKPSPDNCQSISICHGPWATTFTIRVHVPETLADKTVRVQFMLGANLDVIFDSVLGDDGRVQVIDISGQQQPPPPECERQRRGRPRHGLLRGRCR